MTELISFFTKFWFWILVGSFIAGSIIQFYNPAVPQSTTVLNQYESATGTSIIILPCDNQASLTVYNNFLNEYGSKYTSES